MQPHDSDVTVRIAIASGGVRMLNEDVVRALGIRSPSSMPWRPTSSGSWSSSVCTRDGRPAPEVRGRTVILVDDGLATS